MAQAILPAGLTTNVSSPDAPRNVHQQIFDLDKVPRLLRNATRMKVTHSLPITLIVLCFALLPLAPAVVPAPDGGYPGFTTAEGTKALFSLTTGSANTAVGWFTLFSDTTGSFNTATGAGTLLFNTADAITAFGAAALLFNTTGINNTAVGAAALLSNTTGGFNTANGKFALHSNTTGSFNTANGFGALEFNTTGSGNTALGDGAGVNVFTADNVISIGAPGADVSNGCYIGRIFGATSSSGAAVVVNFEGKLGTMTSSRRFKEEIKPMDRASEIVYALEP